MSALTTDRESAFQPSKLVSAPMAAVKIFKGALVKINAAGYAAGCAAEAGAVFLGVATETVDNSAGAAGDLNIQVETALDVTLIQQTGFVALDAGSKVYASDDNLVSVTQASNQQQVGWIVRVDSATQIRVRLTPGV